MAGALDSLVGCNLVFGKKAKAACRERQAQRDAERTARVEARVEGRSDRRASKDGRKVAKRESRDDRREANQASRDGRKVAKSEERTERQAQRQASGNTFWDGFLKAQASAHGSAEKFWGVDGSGAPGALDGWFGMSGSPAFGATTGSTPAEPESDEGALEGFLDDDMAPLVGVVLAGMMAAVGVPLAVMAFR